MKKIVAFLAFLALVLVVCAYSSFDEFSITKGEKFGLKIGDSKIEAYKKLKPFLNHFTSRGDKVFTQVEVYGKGVQYLATNSGHRIYIEPMFHLVGYDYYKHIDNWRFYINASSLNTIEVKFCENKLCEIYRNKRPFELP